jgi:uncharacterized protein with HEPN domain
LTEPSRLKSHDAASAQGAIARYLKGKTFDDYQRDDLLQAAVERRSEIAAEALNQLSKSHPSIASRIADLPSIVGFANVVAHEYAAVSSRIVWDLAQNRAPVLLAQTETLLAELSTNSKDSGGAKS